MNKTDKNAAELLLSEWQRRLNLGDWVIRIKPDCLPDDMGLETLPERPNGSRSTSRL